MALELRQQLKLSQQLVMTPQLQQAIKLLQLSRLELAATIQQEIEQNPLLEEVGQTLEQEDSEDAGRREGEGEFDEPLRPVVDLPPEVRMEPTSALGEIDWQDYANEYESLPSTQRSGDESDLPSRLDILSKKPDLNSHLQWQLRLSGLSPEE
jgi:RNA polymerase sigma-54 factor